MKVSLILYREETKTDRDTLPHRYTMGCACYSGDSETSELSLFDSLHKCLVRTDLVVRRVIKTRLLYFDRRRVRRGEDFFTLGHAGGISDLRQIVAAIKRNRACAF